MELISNGESGVYRIFFVLIYQSQEWNSGEAGIILCCAFYSKDRFIQNIIINTHYLHFSQTYRAPIHTYSMVFSMSININLSTSNTAIMCLSGRHDGFKSFFFSFKPFRSYCPF
uniref:Uncharacterized protein n=1 Tax=Cacopsylla melanoneura TaxID=428564 RepID=A0A8D8WI14_9HEMI